MVNKFEVSNLSDDDVGEEKLKPKIDQKKKKKLKMKKNFKIVNDEENVDENNAEENESNGNGKTETEPENNEKQMRTLFIGNLPANFSMKNLKKILQQYGKVISIRVRCVAPAKITLSKKVAYLSNQMNENKKTVNAYVVFKQMESVQMALELNGTKFDEHTIQVDSLINDHHYDHSKSIFLGNLSFKTTEDELREFFNDCGEIKSVRIVRDSKTGIGKGFGYVNFSSKDGVVLAMEKNGQLFNKREIRIKHYQYNNNDKNEDNKKSKKSKKIKKNKSNNDNNNQNDDEYQGEFSRMKMKKLSNNQKIKRTKKNRRLNGMKMMKKQKQKIAQIMQQ